MEQRPSVRPHGLDWPGDRERDIAIASGLGAESTWRVLVAIPDQRTGVPHAINAKILERAGSGYTVKKLLDMDPEMQKRLKDANKAREKIRVFADSRLGPQQIGEIERAAKELLDSH